MLKTFCHLHDEEGIFRFYVGGALGVDMWAAEQLLYLKEQPGYQDIELIVALPFEGHDPYHYIRLIVTGISDTKKALVFLKQHFGDSSFQQTKDRLKELPLLIYSGLDTGTAPLENSLDRWGLMYEKQQISLEKFLEDQAYIRNL